MVSIALYTLQALFAAVKAVARFVRYRSVHSCGVLNPLPEALGILNLEDIKAMIYSFTHLAF